MELVQELTQQLGINQQQASGGLGLLLGMAKSKLGSNFGQVAQHVPNADQLIQSAPPASSPGAKTGGGGALGAIGGLLGSKGGAMGGLGNLAGGFQQLGIAPNLIGKFVSVVLNFFQARGGAPTRGLLEQAFA